MPPPKFSLVEIRLQREWIAQQAARPEGVTVDETAEKYDIARDLARDRIELMARKGTLARAKFMVRGRINARYFTTRQAADAWMASSGAESPTAKALKVKPERNPALVAGERVPVQWIDALPDKPLPIRPGAEDYRQHPSRMGNNLYYPDGRVERIES